MRRNIKKLWKRFIAEERGNALILAALAMIGLLGMTGLVLDGGLVYMTKSELQKVANAAVLSGAQELTNSEQKVDLVVQDILTAHHESASLATLNVVMEKQVGVDLSKTVKLTFLSLFGFDKVDVKVHAAAGLFPMGKAAGAAPLGIDQSIPLEFNQKYQLKVDSSGVQSGDFGILALGGPGARTYEENLQFGYQEEIKIGDVLDTQTGNVAGDTRVAIQARIDGCPDISGDYSQRDCSRILLVPVYEPYQYDQNQLKQIKITGFAYFYITDPMNINDTSVSGIFIKRAGTGLFAEGSQDRGAYTIRLTE